MKNENYNANIKSTFWGDFELIKFFACQDIGLTPFNSLSNAKFKALNKQKQKPKKVHREIGHVSSEALFPAIFLIFRRARCCPYIIIIVVVVVIVVIIIIIIIVVVTQETEGGAISSLWCNPGLFHMISVGAVSHRAGSAEHIGEQTAVG